MLNMMLLLLFMVPHFQAVLRCFRHDVRSSFIRSYRPPPLEPTSGIWMRGIIVRGTHGESGNREVFAESQLSSDKFKVKPEV